MLTDSTSQTALRQHHLFGALPQPIFQEVCHLAIQKRIEVGGVLFHQGDVAERFYLLCYGHITLTRVLPEGHEKLVEVISPGQSFAEALMFSGARHYPVTATALKPSSLVSIDASHYRHVLEGQPKTCLELLGRLSKCLHRRLEEIDTLTFANASRRVARYLCQEQIARNGTIQLCVPKRMIASQLGIQPETFSRILHRLMDNGLIAMERRVIRVIDQARLANYHD